MLSAIFIGVGKHYSLFVHGVIKYPTGGSVYLNYIGSTKVN